MTAIEQAIEALENYVTTIATAGGGDKQLFMAAIRQADDNARAALTALRGVKEQPVAYGYWNERLGWYGLSLQPGGSYTEPDRRPLFATPPRAERMSEAEIRDMVTEWIDESETHIKYGICLARDVESEVLRRAGGGV